ncbi:MAG: nicotinate-nucleotide adenylyltransferase [Flavobacteriales bacterium]|nr:nicotinate-nucleotide adenylyltransferase [Flavobacteriales bacterium]
MRIGLFFGSFNPIHQGHLILSQFILEQAKLDEIWFVVSPQNPLKSMKDLYPENHRLEMVKLSIKDQPRFKACDIEFQMPRPSYTYNTLLALGKKHPKDEFALILGSDNLQHFDKWKDHERILLEYELIVYNRENNAGGDFSKNQKVRMIKGPMLNISSTQIRGYLRIGRSIKFMVPKEVEEYLETHLKE